MGIKTFPKLILLYNEMELLNFEMELLNRGTDYS